MNTSVVDFPSGVFTILGSPFGPPFPIGKWNLHVWMICGYTPMATQIGNLHIYIYIILAKPAYIEIHFATISVTVFTSINLSIYGGFHISSPRCGAHQLCAASSRKESFKEPPAFLSTSDAMKMGSKWHSPRSDGFDILRIYHNFSIQMATWVCLKMVNTSEWLSD